MESVAVFVTLFPLMVMYFRIDYRHKMIRYLFYCLSLKLVVDLTMLIMASYRIGNLYLYNSYVLVSYFLIALMFYESFENKSSKKLCVASSLIFAVTFIIESLHTGITNTLLYSPVLQCVLIITFCVIYFWELTQSLKVRFILEYAPFWVVSGLLLNYSALTFVVIVFNGIDQWDASQDLRLIADLAPVFESFASFWIAIGLLKSK